MVLKINIIHINKTKFEKVGLKYVSINLWQVVGAFLRTVDTTSIYVVSTAYRKLSFFGGVSVDFYLIETLSKVNVGISS